MYKTCRANISFPLADETGRVWIGGPESGNVWGSWDKIQSLGESVEIRISWKQRNLTSLLLKKTAYYGFAVIKSKEKEPSKGDFEQK